ncbi:hypothetical protein GOM49_11760 [Clostridium bovifaecis]|uniref:Uncharacterized protein n=1 Tax=Clostridium bovifaecis TaxID=2184719 RepID=A0A6I6F3B9_9CLOT|nr:hypothetical protein GOM49_11760 [Clostridium bovifaecis]
MNIMTLIVIAMIGEAVWETLKMLWQRKQKFNFDRIGALIISLVLSFSTGLDMLALVGIPTKIPYVGVALTGILISRGSNFMHDIIASISNVYQNTKCGVPREESIKKPGDSK